MADFASQNANISLNAQARDKMAPQAPKIQFGPSCEPRIRSDAIRPAHCPPDAQRQKIPGIWEGIDRSTSIKMTTSELTRLMQQLDTSNGLNLKQGNIILY
jgi:hypothetical protein